MRVSDSEVAPTGDAEAPALARGATVGRFLILGLVGRGAMGEVYAAYDPELDRRIAIKLMRARADGFGDQRARLMREAKATAKISHPNVVVVYDAGTLGERVFIAMEFIEGHTLRYWLAAQERTWADVLAVFIAAGRGLAAAHEKELVHRDFKPDNVMVTAQGGQVRVMDFGLARFVISGRSGEVPSAIDLDATMEVGAAPPPRGAVDALTRTGSILGTPAYMSPEQLRSQPADARSDQFSFSVALYESLFGQRPFAGQTFEELSANVLAGRMRPPPRRNGVPAALSAILARGLKADPELRYPAMADLLDDLARVAASGRTSFAASAAAKLAGTWEAPEDEPGVLSPSKQAIQHAFLATGKPYAGATFAAVSDVLDRYARRWTDLYVEVCEATHVRGEQSAEVLDLRMACLNEGLDDLRALCRLLRDATAQVVENAVQAAQALGTLDRVKDNTLLRAVIRPPDDPATRAAVERLRLRLVEVRALRHVGRISAGLAAAGPLTEEAQRLGYAPLLAEILLATGRLKLEDLLTSEDAGPVLEQAYRTAVVARHDEVAAAAATVLAYQAGYLRSRAEIGEFWIQHAEDLLNRIGASDAQWGFYYSNRAMLYQLRGRLDAAIQASHLTLAAYERAFGPRSAEFAWATGHLAEILARDNNFEAAVEVCGRAVALMTEVLGPDHARAALYRANLGQYLYRVGRLDEAVDAATKALAVLEREVDGKSLALSQPLRTLGLCHLQRGNFREAVERLERALAIREVAQVEGRWLAEVRYPLGRALFHLGNRARGLAYVRAARDEYSNGALTTLVRKDLGELESWLAAHGEAPAKPQPSRPPKPQRARGAVAKSAASRARKRRAR